MEHVVGLSTQSVTGMGVWSRGFAKIGVRVGMTVLITIVAIVCPSFDRVMALMGSAFCFTICVILPVMFYLRLYGKEIGRAERIFDWFLVVLCSVLAIIGTVWAFLPPSLTGVGVKPSVLT